jgi:excisionase family DNA binding protein
MVIYGYLGYFGTSRPVTTDPRPDSASYDRRRPKGATLADALLGTLDDASARELAERLRPHLPVDPNRFLDAREAADVLGLHPDTLVRMARTGRIWAQKVGREWRFRADRLEIHPIDSGPQATPRSFRARHSRTAPRSSAAAIRGSS